MGISVREASVREPGDEGRPLDVQEVSGWSGQDEGEGKEPDDKQTPLTGTQLRKPIGLRAVLTTLHRVGCDPCRTPLTSHASRTSSGSSCALSSVANSASHAELSDV